MPGLESQLHTLMVLVQSGDAKAYEKLLYLVSDITSRFLTQKQIADYDQDDILQEVLLSVHHAKKTFTQGQSSLAWVHAIIRFKLTDFFRKKYKINAREIQHDIDHFLYEDCVENCIEIDELRVFLKQQLNQLTPLQKDIITKMKLEGYSIKAVASELGISESNVKINAFRGYKKLHALLSNSPYHVVCIFLVMLNDSLMKGYKG